MVQDDLSKKVAIVGRAWKGLYLLDKNSMRNEFNNCFMSCNSG